MPDKLHIFISYARKDGRDLALRLRGDLIERDYDVWLDTAEIEGGASWSNEIEAAIDRCDVALALLSTGSYHSEICRAEQLRSLRKGKRVIPLLVQATVNAPCISNISTIATSVMRASTQRRCKPCWAISAAEKHAPFPTPFGRPSTMRRRCRPPLSIVPMSLTVCAAPWWATGATARWR